MVNKNIVVTYEEVHPKVFFKNNWFFLLAHKFSKLQIWNQLYFFNKYFCNSLKTIVY